MVTVARDLKKMHMERFFLSHYMSFFFIILDWFIIQFSGLLALALRFDFKVPEHFFEVVRQYSLTVSMVFILVNALFGLYKSLWRFAGTHELFSIVIATTMNMAGLFLTAFLTGFSMPRSFYILLYLLIVSATSASRVSYRLVRRVKNWVVRDDVYKNRILLVGAGKAGETVLRELLSNSDLRKKPVGIIDDDLQKVGKKLHGVPIIGTRSCLRDKAEILKIDEIIIAMPSANHIAVREIAGIAAQTKCKLRILPSLDDLVNERVQFKHVRDVDIEDLLGRPSVRADLKQIEAFFHEKTILVTGGGGSIGSELCRQIARFKPSKLIIVDIYENNAYDIQQELKKVYKGKMNLYVHIASVRDLSSMQHIFNLYHPDVVFHAAAHKHVPLMEAAPYEAIKNNVIGTENMASLSVKYKVKKFILISTDKAVNPTNIMGASKRLAELVIQSMNNPGETEFAAVRFGNVLGSNGSVVPIFKKQILEGGPVLVTHPDVIRYFMTIPEAVELVLQAVALANGGEVFVLDMGRPVKIVDLARDLIKLSGFEPGRDIEIKFTGLRPGEKLYEELLTQQEGLLRTVNERILVGYEHTDTREYTVQHVLAELKRLVCCSDTCTLEARQTLDDLICKIVPTYTPTLKQTLKELH